MNKKTLPSWGRTRGAFDWGAGYLRGPSLTHNRHLLSIYAEGECTGSGKPELSVCILLCSCFAIVAKFLCLLLVSDSLGKIVQPGPTNTYSSVPRWKSGLYVEPPVEDRFMLEINLLSVISGAHDDSLPPAASCICKPVINGIGSRGRDVRFPAEAAQA